MVQNLSGEGDVKDIRLRRPWRGKADLDKPMA